MYVTGFPATMSDNGTPADPRYHTRSCMPFSTSAREGQFPSSGNFPHVRSVWEHWLTRGNGRLPNHDHGNIAFALDAGASIIVPQVDTVEQARHVASATKFGVAHRGTRSAPPARWLPGSNADMTLDPSRTLWQNLNDQAALIIQTESELGVRNLDAILSAVGDDVDAVFLGVLDLRISMGLDGIWGSEPEFLAVVRIFEETLHKHNKPFAGPTLDGNWQRGANKTMTIVTGDFIALLSQRAALSGARGNLPASKKNETWTTVDV